MSERAMTNTDRELYREGGGDGNGMSHYEPSVHVTEDGRIGMNVGGLVITLPIREWHERAQRAEDGLPAPTEPGHVAFEVEVIPHDWPNDGMGWHKGRDTPERVAQILRDYANQVEFFTPPTPERRELSEAEMAALMAEKFAG